MTPTPTPTSTPPASRRRADPEPAVAAAGPGVRVVLATPAPLTHRTAEENLGLGYLAAVLRRDGHQVTILDGWLEGLSVTELAERIHDARPELLGFACYRSNMARAIQTREALAARGASPLTVAGGYGPSFHPGEFLDAGFDAVVRGEGEAPLLALAAHVRHGEPALEAIPGLSHRRPDGSHQHHREPAPKLPLDELPDPARDTLALTRARRSMVAVQTARGCQASCTFCSIVAFERLGAGPTWRQRSLTRLVDELEALAARGVTHIKFVDDSLLEPPRDADWCHALADELTRRGLALRLRASVRADRIDEQVVAGLARAGFFSLACGIENFATTALRRMAKRADLEANCRALDAFARHGLLVQAGHILFDDQTTVAELAANHHYMRRYRTTVSKGVFTEMYAAAGTNYTRRLTRQGLLQPAARDELGNIAYQVADPAARVFHQRLKRWHRHRAGLYDQVVDPLSAPKALEPDEVTRFHRLATQLRDQDLAVFGGLLELAAEHPGHSPTALAAFEAATGDYLDAQIAAAAADTAAVQAEVLAAYRDAGLVYDADPNPFLDTTGGRA